MNADQDRSERVAALRAQLETAFEAHDADAAIDATLEAVDRDALTVEDLYLEVLEPLLADTGRRWHAGSLRVWEEHLASAAVRGIIEAMRPRVRAFADAVDAARPDSEPRRALFACPPEEWHVLGLRMLTDRFAMRGWRTYYLGADVPTAEIVSAARALKADLVVLNAATHYERLELRERIEGVRTQLAGRLVLVSGSAFSREHEDWSANELVDPDAIPDAYA